MATAKVRTYLEMRSPDQLRPGRPSARPLVLQPEADRGVVRHLQTAVGTPHRWSCLDWSDDEWDAELGRTGLRHWVPVVDDAAAGLVSIAFGAGGDHEITVFGLLPEHVGHGLGGDLLTRTVRLAWGDGARRVWLRTTSWDHPHALANYLARGFRVIDDPSAGRP